MTGVTAVMVSHGAAAPATLVLNLDAAALGAVPGNVITTSANFNGTTQYLTSNSSAFTLAGDFTVEGWYYPTNIASTRTLFTLGSETTERYTVFLGNSASSNTSVSTNLFGSGSTNFIGNVTANSWSHIAVTRSGSNVRVYINGTASTTIDTQAGTIGNGVLRVGADGSGATLFVGNMSNFRIVRSALYTGNTLTVPTVTLRAVSGTSLLLPLTASPFMDVSTNLLTVTNIGTTTTSVLAPSLTAATTDLLSSSMTLINTGGISWATTTGGILRKTTSSTAELLSFGPDYSSASQAYTVMMVYRSVSGTAGRLLNANSASPDWLMGLWGSGGGVQDIFFNGAFVGSSSTAQDGTWRFAWMTSNGTSTTNAYVAGSTQPTSTFGTAAQTGGFNGLRLFGRFATSTTSSEVVTADVGLVKIWNGVLTLAQIQAQHAAYKARFGY